MSKKTNSRNGSLGRALIKDRFSSKKANRGHDNLLHSSDLNDGYDWGRLNLQSVTEQNSFEEFLATAELAGTEFQAEKLNIKFVRPNDTFGVPTCEERKRFDKAKGEKGKLLKIPRRPRWNASTTAEELQEAERDAFLEWRRSLAALNDQDGITLTPYEKNLDFWRQLWRVVERSDIVVQIVDARNPLLFRCEDLEEYVKEVDESKINMLLVNKADFLTDRQRLIWARYFDSVGVRAAFFSAVKSTVDLRREAVDEEEERRSENEEGSDTGEEEEDVEREFGTGDAQKRAIVDEIEDDGENESETESRGLHDGVDQETRGGRENSADILDRDALIELFDRLIGDRPRPTPSAGADDGRRNVPTVGLVGYPNVGKSSTINALLMDKKVSVSATPGKTKHFQTVLVKESLMLCDCPGLVMPMMVASRADMLLWGILPIDQMRDYEAAVQLLSVLMCSGGGGGGAGAGRHQLQAHYSVMLPTPPEGDDPDRPPTARELLDVYAYSRGMMTQNGQPDGARAARRLLKDFVEGRLLHCCQPPGYHMTTPFHTFVASKPTAKLARPTAQAVRAVRQMNGQSGEELDRAFFDKVSLGAHVKGVSKIIPGQNSGVHGVDKSKKPWKDHSAKRNKKEKLRRLYRHLDQ